MCMYVYLSYGCRIRSSGSPGIETACSVPSILVLLLSSIMTLPPINPRLDGTIPKHFLEHRSKRVNTCLLLLLLLLLILLLLLLMILISI